MSGAPLWTLIVDNSVLTTTTVDELDFEGQRRDREHAGPKRRDDRCLHQDRGEPEKWYRFQKRQPPPRTPQ